MKVIWKNRMREKIRTDRYRQNIGSLGERTVKTFLRKRGYRILSENFSTPFGEIDLVTENNGRIIFVEVKTRISDRFGPPLESITEIKQKHILRNCIFFLKRYNLCDRPCRIDAVGVNLDDRGNLIILKHIKNAIEMEDY